MRKQIAFVAILMSSMVGLISGGSACAEEKDMKAVRAAAEQFYSALNEMFTGELRPMK